MAGREGLRLAEADRPDPPGEVARSAQGGLAVHLQLRRAQLVQAAKAHRTERSVRPGQSCASTPQRAGNGLQKSLKPPRQHSPKHHFEPTASPIHPQKPRKTPRSAEVQQAPSAVSTVLRVQRFSWADAADA